MVLCRAPCLGQKKKATPFVLPRDAVGGSGVPGGTVLSPLAGLEEEGVSRLPPPSASAQGEVKVRTAFLAAEPIKISVRPSSKKEVALTEDQKEMLSAVFGPVRPRKKGESS